MVHNCSIFSDKTIFSGGTVGFITDMNGKKRPKMFRMNFCERQVYYLLFSKYYLNNCGYSPTVAPENYDRADIAANNVL